MTQTSAPIAVGALPTIELLGLRVARLNRAELVRRLLDAAATRARPLRVGYLNAAQVNLAFDDPTFAGLLQRTDLLYADGQSIVWAARLRGTAPLPERLSAGDFMRDFIHAAAQSGVRLALIGGRPGEAELAAETFRTWAPQLRIVWTRDGYFEDAAGPAILDQLVQAEADCVLLGMGAPRQERWAHIWAETETGRPRVWWCVGALFEYFAGEDARRRAPEWMRHSGLEWLFRLALEPGRLWRRYLLGNPAFVTRVLLNRKPGSGRESNPAA